METVLFEPTERDHLIAHEKIQKEKGIVLLVVTITGLIGAGVGAILGVLYVGALVGMVTGVALGIYVLYRLELKTARENALKDDANNSGATVDFVLDLDQESADTNETESQLHKNGNNGEW